MTIEFNPFVGCLSQDSFKLLPQPQVVLPRAYLNKSTDEAELERKTDYLLQSMWLLGLGTELCTVLGADHITLVLPKADSR